MIEPTTFFGWPLRTIAQRRALVVVYYAVLAALFGAALRFAHGYAGPILCSTFALGSLLGGVRPGGPVKLFTEPSAPVSTGVLDEAPLTLGLAGGDTRRWGPLPWSPLDEREYAQRDRAHFVAYRLLSFGMLMAAGLFWMGMVWQPAATEHAAPMLLWLLAVTGLSLPASVVLWTEPEFADGEMHVVAAR